MGSAVDKAKRSRRSQVRALKMVSQIKLSSDRDRRNTQTNWLGETQGARKNHAVIDAKKL